MKSLLAFWMGGAAVASTPVPATAGYRGLMAFWMGGGSQDSGAAASVSEWLIRARRRGRR